MSYPITNTSKDPYFIATRTEETGNRGVLSEKKFYPQLKKDLEKEPQLAELATMILHDFKSEKILWNQKDLSHSIAFSPNDAAMQKIADHYQQKYGILIEFCHYDDLGSKLKEYQNSSVHQNQPFGLILRSNFIRSAHVSPLLIDFRSQNRIIILFDVLGKKAHSCKTTREVCENESIQFLAHTQTRQASGDECRIDSLVFLRNALIDLKKNPSNVNLIERFPDIAEKLPPKWSYTDQITPKTFKEEGVPEGVKVPRDSSSRNSNKRENPESLNEFRERFTRDSEIEYTFHFKTTSQQGYHPQKSIELPSMTMIPDAYDCSDRKAIPGFIKVIWRTSLPLNVYTLKKAERLVENLGIPIFNLNGTIKKTGLLDQTFPRKKESKASAVPTENTFTSNENIEENLGNANSQPSGSQRENTPAGIADEASPPISDTLNFEKQNTQKKCSLWKIIALSIAIPALSILLSGFEIKREN